jgi:hypothetical protein
MKIDYGKIIVEVAGGKRDVLYRQARADNGGIGGIGWIGLVIRRLDWVLGME